jgi:hypothetical protein
LRYTKDSKSIEFSSAFNPIAIKNKQVSRKKRWAIFELSHGSEEMEDSCGSATHQKIHQYNQINIPQRVG